MTTETDAVQIPRGEYERLVRIASAVGECNPRDVPDHVFKAWQDTTSARNFRSLKEAIRVAVDHAGGRETEWGERAEKCFEILEDALKPMGQQTSDYH